MTERPIDFVYKHPSEQDVSFLESHSSLVEIPPSDRIQISPEYFKMKLKGATQRIYAREAVAIRLQDVAQSLPSGFGLVIFDVFRPIQTQIDLYQHYEQDVLKKHPDLDTHQLKAETTRYVAYPSQEPETLSPHNSGGSVDLGLTFEGKICNMGTPFDGFQIESQTAFFEPSQDTHPHSFKNLRRILYHSMIEAGFTNYSEEWWHYDLGNRIWAKNLSRQGDYSIKTIYHSAESLH